MSNWELTQQILQDPGNPIIKKPLLTDKYLTKPPFRFLHDVISAVQRETGFAVGLYSDAELDAKAIQDKESKVAYLAKMMDVVSAVLSEAVPAKPLKVVAGLEPDNTNVFLQMLGKACRMDATKAVQKVLGGDNGAAAAAPRPTSRPSSQHATKADEEPEAAAVAAAATRSSSKRSSSKDGAEKSSRSKPREKEEAKEEKKDEKKEREKEREDKREQKEKKERREEDKRPEPERALARQPSSNSTGGASAAPKAKTREDAIAAEPAARDASPSEAPKFSRPQSARKAPPKLPASNVATPVASRPVRKGPSGNAPPERPGTSGGRPGAPLVQVYEERSGKADDDDDDVEVVTEQAPAAFVRSNAAATGNEGVLVKNILEAERSLKKAGEEAAAPAEEEAAGTGIILGKRRGAAAGSGGKADASTVRELVQKLVQSSHPLAKSMDYLQEDLDNMAKEYRFWMTERRVYQDKLADEQRMVVDTAQVAAQLAEQGGQIRQAKDRILGLKAQILRNEESVAKLLGMVTGAH